MRDKKEKAGKREENGRAVGKEASWRKGKGEAEN